MTKILLPTHLRRSCHHAGVCCTSPDVAISAEECRGIAEAAEAHDLEKRFLRENGGEDPPMLAKTCGRCVFLTDETRCALHQAAGPQAKPLGCRQFPFLFTETPDGVYTGVSFACPSAVEGKGLPLEELRGEIEALERSGAVRFAAPETIDLAEDLPIAWSDYRAMEEALLDLLGDEQAPIEESLVAGSVWLGMLEIFVRQARDQQGVAPGESIAHFIESMRQNQYARVRQIARRPSGSPMLARAFLGMLIAFRNSLSRRRGTPGVVATILWNYARHVLRAGAIRIEPLDGSVRYARFRGVAFDGAEPFAQEILRRVLVHCIERKDLLRGGDIARGYGLLVIFHALVRWYAKVLAARQGLQRVGRAQLIEAVSLAERYYGAHSRFFDLFETYPVLNGIFFSVMRQKNFAHSLGR